MESLDGRLRDEINRASQDHGHKLENGLSTVTSLVDSTGSRLRDDISQFANEVKRRDGALQLKKCGRQSRPETEGRDSTSSSGCQFQVGQVPPKSDQHRGKYLGSNARGTLAFGG